MRTCVLITVIAYFTQAVSGYEYQVPRGFVAQGQQSNGHLAQAPGYAFHAQGSYSQFSEHSSAQSQQNNYPYSVHNSYNTQLANQVQSGSVYQNLQEISGVNTQPVQPIVTKHVYFHVPPPDEVVTPVEPSLLTKRRKSYNIIFITLPPNKVRYNPYATTDAKTLIYVLVKSPDDQPKTNPKPSQPNHEVFYVKYKDSVKNPTVVSNGGFIQQNFERELRPGLVNGQ